MGFKVGVLIDRYSKRAVDDLGLDLVLEEDYMGYSIAVNRLFFHPKVIESDVVITGGDDIYPDKNFRAQEIRDYFLGIFPDTFGVISPKNEFGKVETANTPFIGRDFFLRINKGRGPFWPEYFHFFSDTELYDVANSLNSLHVTDKFVLYHDHWSRIHSPLFRLLDLAKRLFLFWKYEDKFPNKGNRPTHIKEALAHWDEK